VKWRRRGCPGGRRHRNNSGSHNGAGGALIGAIAGGIAGGTLGNSVDQPKRHSLPGPRRMRRPTWWWRKIRRRRRPAGRVVTGQPAPNYGVGERSLDLCEQRLRLVRGGWRMPPPYCRVYVAPHGGIAAAAMCTPRLLALTRIAAGAATPGQAWTA